LIKQPKLRPLSSIYTIPLIEAIMKANPPPEQGFRSCLVILRLVKSYGAHRLEAACRRGNDISATTYGSIASIIKQGLDRAPHQDSAQNAERKAPIRHTSDVGRWESSVINIQPPTGCTRARAPQPDADMDRRG
jgi:hypothetical protein